MMYVRGLILVVILLALGVVPRLVSSASTRNDNSNITPTKVRVVHPKETGNVNLTLPSTITANQQINVNARATGYVQKYLVDIGAKVRKGQPLAILDVPEVEQQTEAAVSDVVRARADEAQARAQTTQAVAALASSQSSVSEAQARELQSEANLATYEARLDQARHTLKSRQAAQASAFSTLGLATKTNERWVRLLADGAVAPQDADQRRVDYETARANYKSSIALVEEARAEYVAAEKQILAGQADLQATAFAYKAAVQNAEGARAGVQSNIANVQANHANVRTSVANVTRARILQHFREVTAPYDGVITSRAVYRGALVDPSSTLFQMASLDNFRIQVRVPEDYLANIHLNQAVNITVLELPGKIYPAKVTRFAGSLDENAKTLLVEMVVPNTHRDLFTGMYAQVHFRLAANKAVLIPSTALLINAGGIQVLKINDGKVHYEQVELGRDLGAEVEVVKGITAKDEVMLIPTVSYEEGTKVDTELSSATPSPTASPNSSGNPGSSVTSGTPDGSSSPNETASPALR
jgi:RND family efflux transporter MFP subunit